MSLVNCGDPCTCSLKVAAPLVEQTSKSFSHRGARASGPPQAARLPSGFPVRKCMRRVGTAGSRTPLTLYSNSTIVSLRYILVRYLVYMYVPWYQILPPLGYFAPPFAPRFFSRFRLVFVSTEVVPPMTSVEELAKSTAYEYANAATVGVRRAQGPCHGGRSGTGLHNRQLDPISFGQWRNPDSSVSYAPWKATAWQPPRPPMKSPMSTPQYDVHI